MDSQPQFDEHDPRAWLERAGLLFLQHQCYTASIASFSRLVQIEPSYAMGWYGLGNSLFCYSGQNQDLDLLRDGVSCAKRAQELDPANNIAANLIEIVASRTPLPAEEVENAPVANEIPTDLPERTGFTDTTFARSTATFADPGERMLIVMLLGSFNEPWSTEILLAALGDPDHHVCMAALKRLNPAGGDRRIDEKLQQLAFSDDREQIEPYLTFALSAFAREAGDEDHWAARILNVLGKDSDRP